MTTTTRAAIYARVSTSDQTCENQLLERLVQGDDLESILDGVCRMVEGIFKDSYVSIMLLNGVSADT